MSKILSHFDEKIELDNRDGTNISGCFLFFLFILVILPMLVGIFIGILYATSK